MALSTATARASTKARLDIDSSDTQFDSIIDEFVLSGVKRLYPIAQREVPVQTKSVTVDSYGETTVDLSSLAAPVLAARKVEVSGGQSWVETNDFYHHGTTLFARDLSSSDTQLRIYGVTQFTLADVPEYLEMPVIWYAMSEFYDFLAGNKRKYNIYAANGARSVDNMKEEAQFYEQKANVYLNDRVTLYGVS